MNYLCLTVIEVQTKFILTLMMIKKEYLFTYPNFFYKDNIYNE